MKLHDLGERRLIERVTAAATLDPTRVLLGAGDDCSVTRVDGERLQIVTTDMLVEDVHFVRAALSARQLGRKAVAVNLSDIAAMGGTALDAWISVALPASLEVAWVDELFAGINDVVRAHAVNLLGGDTTRSDAIVINIAVLGEVLASEILVRSAARPGDHIFVSGPVGDAAAGLDALRHRRDAAELIRRHHEPEPHLAVGRRVATSGAARAAIDVSDGLAIDLTRVCAASRVGCELDAARLPLSAELRAYCAENELDPVELALGGGEDYVLLVTGSGELAELGQIDLGRITEGVPELWRDGARVPLEPAGWDPLR